ncbi:MAG TPA: hypothetical protein VHO07_09555 [Streptosporangiaceae bacterium]|jgi:hypothetical protein|nr:hypothetical protein [Streptosporangiaceae bacterium]
MSQFDRSVLTMRTYRMMLIAVLHCIPEHPDESRSRPRGYSVALGWVG